MFSFIVHACIHTCLDRLEGMKEAEPIRLYHDKNIQHLKATIQAGKMKEKHYIPVHKINVSKKVRTSLLAFHAVTGSDDTTSQFAGIGKRTAWSIFIQNTQLLKHFGQSDFPDESTLADEEAFVCFMTLQHMQVLYKKFEEVKEFRLPSSH